MTPSSPPLGPAEEERDSATIGVVEAVSPGVIDVGLLREAPHGTGLREGAFHRFPRINGFVVLPSERGSVLAIVTWLGVDDEYRLSANDPDRIGLPIPRRRLRALPLGVLRRAASLLEGAQPPLELNRGVLVFPTVGDPVRLPTRAEMTAAVPSSGEDRLRLKLGRAPLAGDVAVHVNPNRMFGRHLAVLGNTGSGKSCTVAQLLRASARAPGDAPKAFRAIVLDLNGEYRNSFDDLDDTVRVRRFSVNPSGGDDQLRVPAWAWNFGEWLSFTGASAKSQAPQLRRALHLLRTTQMSNLSNAVVNLVAGRRLIRQYQANAIEPRANSECLSALDNVSVACDAILQTAEDDLAGAVQPLRQELSRVLDSRRGTGSYLWSYGAHLVNANECASLLPLFDAAIEAHGVPEFLGDGFTVDNPVSFDPDHLVELLPLLAADSGNDVVGWVAPLVERLRISLADERLRRISGFVAGESFEGWMKSFLSDDSESQIAILDLSLVPSNVLHLVCAVMARVVLESLERHRRQVPTQQTPVVLVLEEAHALVRRHVGSSDEGDAVPMARLCREAFERVAREGRKFGLSLVVSSQRPSELSETVLSQCNTFLIHRIVNDHDQMLVRRLVPDSLGALVQELPALPSQTALLVGWAIDVPTLVRIDDLSEECRPRSEDPDLGGVWSGQRESRASWASVAAEWTGAGVAIPVADE